MERDRAIAAMDAMLDLGVNVNVHAYKCIDAIGPLEGELRDCFNVEITPTTFTQEQMKDVMAACEELDLHLHWYSFAFKGHMNLVEPDEIRGVER